MFIDFFLFLLDLLSFQDEVKCVKIPLPIQQSSQAHPGVRDCVCHYQCTCQSIKDVRYTADLAVFQFEDVA